jgi:hypothetical protein
MQPSNDLEALSQRVEAILESVNQIKADMATLSEVAKKFEGLPIELNQHITKKIDAYIGRYPPCPYWGTTSNVL